jgi:hypothetical protein
VVLKNRKDIFVESWMREDGWIRVGFSGAEQQERDA